MAGILRSCGVEVLVASSVASALVSLRRAPIDSVVLDLMLPDGDGSEVLRQIRQQKLQTRVCVVTAASDTHLLDRVKQLNPDSLLHKPIDMDQLLDGLDLKK
jgi:DNA-binding response OmpR family regulator